MSLSRISTGSSMASAAKEAWQSKWGVLCCVVLFCVQRSGAVQPLVEVEQGRVHQVVSNSFPLLCKENGGCLLLGTGNGLALHKAGHCVPDLTMVSAWIKGSWTDVLLLLLCVARVPTQCLTASTPAG
jgi:hypothetical protein